MTQDILYNVDDRGVASITLNRPEKHNAFDDVMIAELTRCFEQAGSDPAVRAVVLASNGKNFCAGADAGWMQRMAAYSEVQNRTDALQLAAMLQTLYRLPKPTIARVQGAAFGGAVGLIACCDIAIACKLSKFCLSEVKLGLIPATISPYVIEAMGKRVAKRYFQTAEVFSAYRARRLGLVSEAVSEEQLDDEVNTLLSALLRNGPNAVAQAKALVDKVAGAPIDGTMMQTTSDWIARIRVSEEGQEGLNAFLEKRVPAWVKESE
ncbi:enoyl-CoA hydratase/isomerase family protein [Alteromonas sp. AMM-1]|uniref:enoyl-CoA hydratase/isomerase family protein n=1 Tax=Alteromonas sp. AMM-1 TaxID=3394233 RepID=UPI0039A52337